MERKGKEHLGHRDRRGSMRASGGVLTECTDWPPKALQGTEPFFLFCSHLLKKVYRGLGIKPVQGTFCAVWEVGSLGFAPSVLLPSTVQINGYKCCIVLI